LLLPKCAKRNGDFLYFCAMVAILALMALAFVGAFIQRTIGFGFGIFVMTMLPFLMPSYGEATTLSGSLAMITSFILVYHYWKFISWRYLIPLLIVFLITSIFAIKVVVYLDQNILEKILGVVLIISSIYFWYFADKVKIKPNIATQASLGTLSGFMGGFFAMQGPPAVLYFIEVAKRKEEYIALAQAYFAFGNLAMTFYRAKVGFFTSEVATAWLWCVPAVLLGTWVGSLVFKYLSLDLLRHIVFIYIGISGVIALL